MRSPASLGAMTCSVMMWSADCDGAFARAVEAGATAVSPPADTFSGDRLGAVRCPFGHRFVLATRKEEVSDEEIRRRLAAGG
jgi:PhnB protein